MTKIPLLSRPQIWALLIGIVASVVFFVFNQAYIDYQRSSFNNTKALLQNLTPTQQKYAIEALKKGGDSY